VVIQVDAFVIAPDIDAPSAKDATAMPDPIIARISAYSAADAPFSSARNDFTKFDISKPL
jgi:hypothetical protein